MDAGTQYILSVSCRATRRTFAVLAAAKSFEIIYKNEFILYIHIPPEPDCNCETDTTLCLLYVFYSKSWLGCTPLPSTQANFTFSAETPLECKLGTHFSNDFMIHYCFSSLFYVFHTAMSSPLWLASTLPMDAYVAWGGDRGGGQGQSTCHTEYENQHHFYILPYYCWWSFVIHKFTTCRFSLSLNEFQLGWIIYGHK